MRVSRRRGCAFQVCGAAGLRFAGLRVSGFPGCVFHVAGVAGFRLPGSRVSGFPGCRFRFWGVAGSKLQGCGTSPSTRQLQAQRTWAAKPFTREIKKTRNSAKSKHPLLGTQQALLGTQQALFGTQRLFPFWGQFCADFARQSANLHRRRVDLADRHGNEPGRSFGKHVDLRTFLSTPQCLPW